MSTQSNVLNNEDLQRRLLFTLFCVAIFRFGIHVPTPGVEIEVVRRFFEQQGGLFGIFNTFTGGALNQFSVFALGIMPYISSSIIFQLLTSMVPYLESLKKEGEQGRKKIQMYTRWGTILLAVVQAYALSNMLIGKEVNGQALFRAQVGVIPFQLMTVLTLTTGTCFVMWLGEQISEKGLGEGASVIIFAGIAAGIPKGAVSLWNLISSGQMSGLIGLGLLVFMLIVLGAIIYFEIAQRRIPIHMSQKGGAAQMMGNYLPLKVNLCGVLPPIFAFAILQFPSTIATFSQAAWVQGLQQYFAPSGALFNIFFIALVTFFSFFYTELMYPPDEMSDNLKKAGKFIPGIRAGKSTAHYIQTVMGRLNVAGAIYLSIICLMPTFLISQAAIPFYFGGTSLLILVGVSLQLIEKINAYRYEAMIKAAQRPRRTRRVSF
ncbi:MAG: preprotein translocase subunit SecY [Bdellovibrionaceae bacterium]|nr:preprotein translocase subunit SecY [Pseudobdellovibrionaceae bacterium]